jgi:translation initiation factor IF-2
MTDVVVLVVAADDGVMPQTVEAINHAKAAGVPIVVALNKIDVANANVVRVMGQLAEHDLQPREWGGKTEVVQTSAITGQGIDDLVEVLSLEAELLELKADPSAPARGTVIESEMDPGRGVVARLLVQDGTLRVGDILLAGPGYGRVRQILDYRGRSMQEASPATPVEVSGLDAVPTAGDLFYVVDNLSEAKEVAEDYRSRAREQQLATKNRITLDNLFQQIASGNVSELPLIVKADMQGSVEVLIASLQKLSTEEVRVRILHAAVGGISTGDVLLAEASGAIILGFHVVADSAGRELAERLGVDVRLYRVIYQLIDEVTKAMEGLLAPEIKEQVLGHAQVREVFKVTRVGAIAGCLVTDGVIQRNSKIRITRDNIVIEDERTLESLKRFKDDAREVRNGMECGMKVAGYDDIKQGDILEAYTTVEVARTL